jgi:hypothetical protein
MVDHMQSTLWLLCCAPTISDSLLFCLSSDIFCDDFTVFYSGYADRIRELLDVSRELSGVRDRSLSHNTSAGNYITEANHIEFSGVKVISCLEGTAFYMLTYIHGFDIK